MSLEILKQRIKDNKLSGVFLFCGPEEYTKDHYASQIRKKIDASPLPEFNHVFFNASSSKISDLEDSVDSLPYMWDTKLIEITDLESARISESDIDDYARVFSDIPDYLTILIVLRSDEQTEESRISKTSKSGLGAFCSLVNECGLVVEFATEKSEKLATWLSKHLTAKGVKFDSNVPKEIISLCGNDMYVLQSELCKLSEVYSGTPLTISDVHKYCSVNSSYKYFDIATALNRRDLVGARRILESLDLSRDKIPLAIGFLAKNYSEILLVKTALDSGKSYDSIAKELKIPQWRVNKIASSSASADMKTLAFAINQLADADMKLKSYSGNPEKILEMAFFRICTYGRKA